MTMTLIHYDNGEHAARVATTSITIISETTGRGISGLLAARELEKLGFTLIIVEASERLGGRAFSSGEHELGGIYLHGNITLKPFIGYP